jgi:hypothetical protein
VQDCAKWRAAYDAFESGQKRLGVTAEEVYQVAGDPSDVTATHDFATLDAAQQFMASDELRSVMSNAGVAGAPDVWYTERT